MVTLNSFYQLEMNRTPTPTFANDIFIQIKLLTIFNIKYKSNTPPLTVIIQHN